MLQGVIDTNILIRAFLKSTGHDRLVFEAFDQGKFEFLYSENLLKELYRVLSYPRIFNKYHLNLSEIEIFLKVITDKAKFIFNPPKVRICRDPDDDELLSIAFAVHNIDPIYIIINDKDLLVLKNKFKEVNILTSQEFLKII